MERNQSAGMMQKYKLSKATTEMEMDMDGLGHRLFLWLSIRILEWSCNEYSISMVIVVYQ
jgi:hypothetical protein